MYDRIQEKNINKYIWTNSSVQYKLIQMISVRNINELNNLGIFLKS